MGKYKYSRDKLGQTTLQEVEAMIQKARWSWLKSYIALLFLTGVRSSEALSLKQGDIRIEGDRLLIEVPILKQRKGMRMGPYSRPRHVLGIPLNAPFTQEIISHWQSLKDPLQPLYPYSRIWAWKKLKEINPNVSPHLFRHDKATKLVRAKTPVDTVQYWMGWSTLNQLMRYMHLGEVDLKDMPDIY